MIVTLILCIVFIVSLIFYCTNVLYILKYIQFNSADLYYYSDEV